jgi:lysozyme family protein
VVTVDAIIDEVIEAEGPALKNDPADPEDPSKYGIGKRTLGRYLPLGRDATLDEVRQVDRALAARIYRQMFVDEPGFTEANIPPAGLRLLVIDYGVNSGPGAPVKALQRLLVTDVDGRPLTVDGGFGPKTVAALRHALALDPRCARWLRDALIADRLLTIDDVTDRRPGYKRYEEGLEDRALKFLRLPV